MQRRRVPRPRFGCDGFTLVEVVVTVALFAIVFVPLAAVFSAGMNASTSNGNQQNAAALAESVISKLRATASTPTGYFSVGFSSATIAGAVTSSGGTYGTSASGNYYWSWDGGSNTPDDQLIVLPSTVSQPSFRLGSGTGTPFAPVMTGVTSGGATYTVTTHVLFSSALSRGCPGSPTTTLTQAYRRVFVTVSWRNGTAALQTLKEDQIVYPGGLVPYHGPQYSTANIPPAPTQIAASTGTPETTGQLDVSFKVPSNWSAGGMCFAIGWAGTDQVVSSTGLVANNDPGYIVPPSAGGTAEYGVSGLVQGSTFVMFVTAFSSDGIESNESGDSATITTPTGPLISSISTTADPGFSPAYGQTGTQLQVTGSGFLAGTGTTTFFFVPNTITNPAKYASYPTVTNAVCASTTTCTVTMPAPCASPACPVTTTNVVNLVAETVPVAGGPTVASPIFVGDQVSYAPIVTSLNPTSGSAGGGYSVAVAVKNFYANSAGGTDILVGGQDVNGQQSCSTTGTVTTCTIKMPSGTAGTSVPVEALTGSNPPFTSADSTANQFTYSS